tara:strand:- start:614 stop:913 length:300 start_codon:yes stop_codon:yes gene_type:complete
MKGTIMNVPLEKRYLTIATGDLRKRLKKAGFTSIYQLSTVQDISYSTAKNIFCKPSCRVRAKTLRSLKNAIDSGFEKVVPSILSFDSALEMVENPSQFN